MSQITLTFSQLERVSCEINELQNSLCKSLQRRHNSAAYPSYIMALIATLRRDRAKERELELQLFDLQNPVL